MEALLGFASGIGLALLSAVISAQVERRSARRSRVEDARFQIYMQLLDLYTTYFWVTTAELHGEEVRAETRDRIRSLTWQIADQLRAADEVDHAEDILDVLLSISYESAADRYRKMDMVIKSLEAKMNPRYSQAVHRISERNLLEYGSQKRGRDTTPGLM